MATASSLLFHHIRTIVVLLVLAGIASLVLVLLASVVAPGVAPSLLMPEPEVMGPFRWDVEPRFTRTA
jgi:hypothetical protein